MTKRTPRMAVNCAKIVLGSATFGQLIVHYKLQHFSILKIKEWGRYSVGVMGSGGRILLSIPIPPVN